MKYDPKKIEKKWQKFWLEKKTFFAPNKSTKQKKLVLIEFPYPSGAGLHMGHMRPFIAGDVTSKFFKLKGFNTMYPMGWDAFGLPAENYAIKNKIHPSVATKKNIANAKKQLTSWGTGFDWGREIDTTDPDYYKWTQKIFLEFYKAGLAYEKEGEINWCPKDKTGLANEEVVDGKCERCGEVVEKKNLRQWYLKITDYAEKLLNGLKHLPEWPDAVKTQQENWIGRSEGAEIRFKIQDSRFKKEIGEVEVFTTRADTLFGVTYIVLAPEIADRFMNGDLRFKDGVQNTEEIKRYIEECNNKTEEERTNDKKEKTGVEIKGIKAINPANGEEVPVWVADYVLGNYGTGAVMAVPAHDERDFEFANKYGLLIKNVITPIRIDKKEPHIPGKKVVERNNVICLLKNPENKKIIVLKWKKQPWTTFVIGGIEEGETPIVAGEREIKKETGFQDFKYVRTLVGPVRSEFFAIHKDVNRIAYTWVILYELNSEEKKPLSSEEAEIHEVTWQDESSLKNLNDFNHSEMDLIYDRLINGDHPNTEEGIVFNSGKFNGLSSEEAREKITEFVGGKIVTKYKLRDWVFSRQRYWGEPIPLVHCEKCGIVPVPEKDLPVKLPNVKNYEPTGTGESPLATIDKWVNTKCPKCGGKAKRETNTMPQWAGSSWYWLRYMDPKNKKEFANLKNQRYWSPVDLYFGGMEHTTLHLLYSRFWNLVFKDRKLVTVSEPYKKRVPHGIILGPDGEKMSKSRGNVVNPDDIIKIYGADTVRLYMMFLGPHGAQVAWNDKGIVGARRFIERVFSLQNIISKKEPIEVTSTLHKTIKKVGEDIESFSFNTAVSAMMIFVNTVFEHKAITEKSFLSFIKILSPLAPHIAEELWQNLNQKGSVFNETWPKFDVKLLKSDTVPLVVQINGKFVKQIDLPTGLTDEDIVKSVKTDEKVAKLIEKKLIKKIVVVKDKIVNFVV